MFSDQELQRCFRYCVALTGDREQASVLLNTTLEIWLRCFALDPPEAPLAYFRKMLRNSFIEEWQPKARREPLEEHAVITMDAAGDLEGMLLDSDDAGRFLGMLPPDERELLFLWSVEDFSVQEIALHLEKPKGIILARLHRLKRHLRASGMIDREVG